MNIVTQTYNGTAYLNERIYATTKELVEDVAGGHLEDIHQIINIDLVAGTSRDITKWVALEVWRIFDADNKFAWKEIREWMESFHLDCDHLTGEMGDLARDFYGR